MSAGGGFSLSLDTLRGAGQAESLLEAATRVSQSRLYQTFYAEYPYFHELVERLRGGESAYTLEDLTHLWRMEPEEADDVLINWCRSVFSSGAGTRAVRKSWSRFCASLLDCAQADS